MSLVKRIPLYGVLYTLFYFQKKKIYIWDEFILDIGSRVTINN